MSLIASRRERLTAEAAYRTRYWVNAHPWLYLPIARARHRQNPDYPVTRGTEFVLEGFGRSGSTFALFAFRSVQPHDVRIAHHTHSSGQVITAVRWGIPTLVIVRPAADATLSHMARHEISASAALRAWVRFHERILPYSHGFVACGFAEMTSDFGAVLHRLNERFGTSFAEWQHTPESAAEVFAMIDRRNLERFGSEMTADRARSLARPTAERTNQKERLRAELDDPALEPLRNRADELYRLLIPDAGP